MLLCGITVTVYKIAPPPCEYLAHWLKEVQAWPGSRALCRACSTMSPSAVIGASRCFSRPTTIASVAGWWPWPARRAGTTVWAYCLMPNHVHLIATPARADGLRATFAEAHRLYTATINARFRNGGAVARTDP